MMKKSKCPLCGNEISDLSRHLVIVHDIKDINHLKSLTSYDDGLEMSLKERNEKDEIKSLNTKKELIKATFKVRGEVKTREKIENIQSLGRLINLMINETDLIDEGINVLIDCLNHNSLEIRESAKTELKHIMENEELNDAIKSKIQINVNNSGL